jgi:hypothetical protein
MLQKVAKDSRCSPNLPNHLCTRKQSEKYSKQIQFSKLYIHVMFNKYRKAQCYIDYLRIIQMVMQEKFRPYAHPP